MKLRALYEPAAADDDVSASAPVEAPPAPPLRSAPCRPWLRLLRDEKSYEACMAIARKIGAIRTSRQAARFIRSAVGSEDQEVFGALYLDTHLRIRGLAETGRGTIDSVQAPIGPTLRLAIETGAQAIVIFHCHPTLVVQPSEADQEVTKAFAKACAAVDILLADHLIIGGHQAYYSFVDAGKLKKP